MLKQLLNFRLRREAVDQWSEMLSFAAEVTKNEDVIGLLNKALVAEQLAEIFISICAEFDEHGQNFIKVLAKNGRLKALPEICEEFLILKKELDNQVDVEITSATTLTETQLAELSSKLEQRLDRKVKLNCSVDETLLSGVIIRTGDLIIDNSTRGRLNRLSDALMS